MNFIISRVAFCPYCKAEDRPHDDDWVLLYGSRRKKFFYHLVDHHIGWKEKGFTPHIFDIKSDAENGLFTVISFCGVIGCGVDITGENEDGTYNWEAKRQSIHQMTIEEIKALKKFRDTGYEL